MRWVSRLITLVVFAALAAGLVVFIRNRVPVSTVGQQFTTSAKLRDASKLVVGSPVVIAGVRIGEVTQLTIEGRFARIDMRLRDDTHIGVDSIVTKRAPSTFGDSYIEILPIGEIGAHNERVLASGEPLLHVMEGSSTDAAIRATERAMPRFELALAALHDFMSGGRAWVNGQLLGALTSIDTWVGDGKLASPLATTDQALATIEDATGRLVAALGGSGPGALAGLSSAEQRVIGLRKDIATSRARLDEAMASTRHGLDGVDRQLDDATAMMAAVRAGSGDDWKGSLGKLVNDGELADSIEDGTEVARDATASFDRFKAYLGVRLEMNVVSKLSRVYITTEIRAHDDKIYLVELEKGLLGGLPSDQLADSAGTNTYTRAQQIADKLRFTAQFGKVIGPFTLRAGIKDSTFGAGTDFMAGRLTLSADVFGSFSRRPDLKLAAALLIFHSVYLVGGVDDLLNKPGYLPIASGNVDVPTQFDKIRFGRDYFLGAQLRFNDEDITTLLRVYGALLASAL